MIKQASQSLVALAFIIWGTVVAAGPPSTVVSEQEFLEFLGGWELEDGTWVNPLGFLESNEKQMRDGSLKERSNNQKSDYADHDTTIPTQAPETTSP